MIALFKKILSVISIILLLGSTFSYADDTIDVEVNAAVQHEIENAIQTASKATETPSINSRSAVVIDRNTKEILYGKNETTQRAMASTTKIMTAMVVIQNTNLDNIVTISKKAAGTGGSRLKLKARDTISVRDLLYGLLLRSGNDAAVALAEYVGGSVEGFATLMNQNAQALGLQHTHFVTPHGLDSKDHYTTAYELALIANDALNNDVFSQIVNTKTTTIHINGNPRSIANTNELLGNLNGVYGVKTGFTNGAGRCLVTSIRRGNLDVVCVVLGADTKKDRTRDSIKLIEYIFQHYQNYDFSEQIIKTFEEWNTINQDRIHIEKGVSNDLDLCLGLEEEKVTYPILKGTQDQIQVDIQSNLNLQAPIQENTRLGKVVVTYQNKVIQEINIVNKNAISKKTMGRYVKEFIQNYHNYLKIILTK